MLELYAISIHQPIQNDQYHQMLSFISESQRQRIDRFRFEADKKRTLYGNVLSRYFIGKILDLPGKSIEFECNSFGKPFIKGYLSVHFNISHSGEWVVCAISNCQVGVDIEEIKSIEMKIAKRFFTKGEYETIVSTREEERIKVFYRIWTMKESYIKYMGKGLSIQLDSFETVKVPSGFSVAGSEKEIAIWQGEVLDGYMLSLCHAAGETCHGILILDIEKLKF